jgi:hypothetical protein
VKKISLTQGKFALVSNKDFKWLSKFKWYALKGETTFYAATNIRIGAKRTVVRMHRIILKPPKNMGVDHKDGDGLNNQRYNIRWADTRQNAMNSKTKSSNTSGYKGVYWSKIRKKWIARINTRANKTTHLGVFCVKKHAVTVYNKAAKKYYGRFAKFNK